MFPAFDLFFQLDHLRGSLFVGIAVEEKKGGWFGSGHQLQERCGGFCRVTGLLSVDGEELGTVGLAGAILGLVLGAEGTGGDRGHADAERAGILVEDAGQADDGLPCFVEAGLSGFVEVSLAGHGARAWDTGDIDDMTGGLLMQVGHDLLDDVDRRGYVPAEAIAGIVDDHVDAAECIVGRLQRIGHRAFIGEVDLQRQEAVVLWRGYGFGEGWQVCGYGFDEGRQVPGGCGYAVTFGQQLFDKG